MPLGMIAEGAANAILGLGLGSINDHRQRKQQRKLQEIQIEGQKEMTDYNMSKQLEMWKNTSYGAQKAEMEKAGLNPGLMYGMGGGGGVTTGTASGSVSGGQAPHGGGEGMGMMMMTLQKGLIEAQIRKTEAETDAVREGIPNISKTGANIEASTANLLQGVENAKAQKLLTDAQRAITDIQTKFLGRTYDARIEEIDRTVEKLTQEAKGLNIHNASEQATIDTKVAAQKAELAGLYARNELMRAQTDAAKSGVELNDATMKKIEAEIVNIGRMATVAERQVAVAELKQKTEANNPGLWNVIGGGIQRTVNWLDRVLPNNIPAGGLQNPK